VVVAGFRGDLYRTPAFGRDARWGAYALQKVRLCRFETGCCWITDLIKRCETVHGDAHALGFLSCSLTRKHRREAKERSCERETGYPHYHFFKAGHYAIWCHTCVGLRSGCHRLVFCSWWIKEFGRQEQVNFVTSQFRSRSPSSLPLESRRDFQVQR
jgi:hypothetical protein